jgi:hypothetical protein
VPLVLTVTDAAGSLDAHPAGETKGAKAIIAHGSGLRADTPPSIFDKKRARLKRRRFGTSAEKNRPPPGFSAAARLEPVGDAFKIGADRCSALCSAERIRHCFGRYCAVFESYRELWYSTILGDFQNRRGFLRWPSSPVRSCLLQSDLSASLILA